MGSRKRGFFQRKRTFKAPPPPPPPIHHDEPYVDYHDYLEEDKPKRAHTTNHHQQLPMHHSNNNRVNVQESEDLNAWSAEDKMNKIFSKLGIISGIHIGVKLYGFNSHLDVYEEIWRLTFIDDVQLREHDVRILNTNRLRDIKCKIKSEGKTGKKKEMICGVVKKLDEFRKYYQSMQYNEHAQYQQGASYQCDVCNKVFAKNSDLSVHRREHSGERQFKCNQCGKSFHNQKKFKQHQKKHKI